MVSKVIQRSLSLRTVVLDGHSAARVRSRAEIQALRRHELRPGGSAQHDVRAHVDAAAVVGETERRADRISAVKRCVGIEPVVALHVVAADRQHFNRIRDHRRPLSARLLLALLEECNSDASNDGASYARGLQRVALDSHDSSAVDEEPDAAIPLQDVVEDVDAVGTFVQMQAY